MLLGGSLGVGERSGEVPIVRRVVDGLLEVKCHFAAAEPAGRKDVARKYEHNVVGAMVCVDHAIDAAQRDLVSRRKDCLHGEQLLSRGFG